MSATIFISHSCKDKEDVAPPADAAPELIQRYRRLEFARSLRAKLLDRLDAEPKFIPFLDVRGGLQAGDIWENGLHQALRSCSGAVVLLSPEAIESGWVLKEATILSWRVFLDEPVVLIPIVLGVSTNDLEKKGFGPLSLNRIQWVRVEGTSSDDIESAVEATVDALVAQLPESPLVAGNVLSPTQRWVEEFAKLLSEVIPSSGALRNDCLIRMCNALTITGDRLKVIDDSPYRGLASETLLAKHTQVGRLLRQAGKPAKPQREILKSLVAPLWVDAAPASRLLYAAAQKKVAVIDANETVSAGDYVKRALCSSIGPPRLVVPSSETDGTHASAMENIVLALNRYLPIEDPIELETQVVEEGPHFVILGRGLALASVLEEVTTTYPQLTFVVAAGENPGKVLTGGWETRGMLLHPRLHAAGGKDRELAGVRYRNQLKSYVESEA